MAQQDACSLLDEDHRRVEMLFAQYHGGSDLQKAQLAHEICHELTVHTMIEEEIFYPAVRRATGDKDLVEHAEEEHDEVNLMIEQILGHGRDDELMKKMQAAVEHHVQEERTKMFPAARKAQGLDLLQLARQLERRKSELMVEA